MKIRFSQTAKTAAIASILTLFSCSAAMARDNEPILGCMTTTTSGSACYNCLSKSCPGTDMGDPKYKQCIESGMDACDKTFPKIVNPMIRSRFLNNLINGTVQMQTK